MNATMTPMEICPSSARSAPTMQTMTYPKLPMKLIRGIIIPDRNWEAKALRQRSSLTVTNLFPNLPSALYALITVWPE